MKKQIQESIVLINTEKTKLRYNLIGNDFKLYQMDNELHIKEFVENVDYTLDKKNGLLSRTINSSIPNYGKQSFYDKGVFDLNDYDGKYDNKDFIIFADYSFDETNLTTEDYAKEIAKNKNQFECLAGYMNRTNLDLLIFGDSISCGYEARDWKNIYYNRLSRYITEKYKANVTLEVLSKAGYTTESVKEHFDRYIKDKRTDVAIIAFGMNDQNCIDGVPYVSPEKYFQNVNYFLDNINCEITPILLSFCQPNPRWNLTNRYISSYIKQLEKISKEREIPFVNIYELWQTEINAGKRSVDLLNNNVNHPTDYGHYIYFEGIKALF